MTGTETAVGGHEPRKARDHRQPLEAEKDTEDSSLSLPRQHGPAGPLTLDFWPPGL